MPPRPPPLDTSASSCCSSSSSPDSMPRVDTWDLLHAEEGTPTSPQRDIENAMLNPLSFLAVDPVPRTARRASKSLTFGQSLDQRLATWITSSCEEQVSSAESPLPSFLLSRPRERSNLVNVV